MSVRKVCIFTGTRAEYGLLRPTMARLHDDADLTLQVLVSGAHLSERLGGTWRQIEEDGFAIDARVPMDLEDDTALGLARATGTAVADLAATLDRLTPDILVVLGDRYEAFAAAAAAMLLRLPIAHIHGGEITAGAMDDAMRHAVTKMAHLHFTAAGPYRDRVIQMGEAPDRVFDAGALGLEVIAATEIMSRDDLARDLGMDLDGPLIVVTHHPETLATTPGQGMENLLAALDDLPDAQIVFTHANADMGGRDINDRADAYARRHADRARSVASLGARRYFSAVHHAQAVVGNSSSGIIEAPFLGTPTVNIGDRQKGRLRAPAVIDCGTGQDDISAAIARALDPAMQDRAAKKETPYGHGESSRVITAALKDADLTGLLHKAFHDLTPGAAA